MHFARLFAGFVLALLCAFGSLLPHAQALENEEFNGPYPGWLNVKTQFGATGNGSTDDTAAIQAAMNQASANMTDGNGGRVVYLPAGTYRITSTLMFPGAGGTTLTNAMLIGDDPATTIVKWDGAVGGRMLWINGPINCSFGRITWDGNNKAAKCVSHFNTITYATNNQHFDVVFKNAQYGLNVEGNVIGDAECAVYRCQFINLSIAAVDIKGDNAYDWWVWYSRFVNCGVGMQVYYGSMNAYNCNFIGSTIADMKVGDARYFSARNNFSSGSKRFLSMEPIAETDPTKNGKAGVWVLQNNRIVNSTQADTIQHGGGWGLFFLLGNEIASAGGTTQGPVVDRIAALGGNHPLYCYNNKFTVASPVRDLVNDVFYLDNQIVSAGSISTTEPQLPPTPPKVARPIIALSPVQPQFLNQNTAPATNQMVQDAIAQAAAMPAGSKPVIYFGASQSFPGFVGNVYKLTTPIIIPANLEVTLTGDAGNAILQPYDAFPNGRAAIILRGPSKATVRDLQVLVNIPENTKNIVVDNADQTNSRIFMNMVKNQSSQRGIVVNGLANTKVNMHNHWMGGANHMTVIGPNSSGNGRTAVFSGAASDVTNGIFHVLNGGRFLARDFWYETGSGQPSELIRVAGTGAQPSRVGIECNYIYNSSNSSDNYPAFFGNNYSGAWSIVGSGIGGGIKLSGNAPDSKFFALGYGAPTNDSALNGNHLFMQSNAAVVGRQTPEYLRSLLDFHMTTQPEPINALPSGVTDVRIINVETAGVKSTDGIFMTAGTF